VKRTLGEIAQLLGGKIIGREDVVIENIRPIDDADVGDITFIADKKFLKKLSATKASAILVPHQTQAEGKNLVLVTDPYADFGKLQALFYPVEHGKKGISSDAYIEEGASVSTEAVIYPHTYISTGAKVEQGAVLYPGVFIGRNAFVGENSILYPNVTVYHGCSIGKRVTIQSGAVIGSDGFGFAAPGRGNNKIPQVGFVQIDDDVEIGANTTIDRATIANEKTWIQRNVKIDNLVQIAHNVVIGENSIIISQVGISGSTKLGKSVIVGGQVGFVGHINIGDNVMIAAGSGVNKDIAAGQTVGGRPPLPLKQFLRVVACEQKLPEMRETINKLKRQVEVLKEKINK
jgi:UDP-3-O-[3-hydroxymyristoyl] glucosamine N-acyltransferase